MAQVKAKTGWTEDKPFIAQEGEFQVLGYDSKTIRKNQEQMQALIDKSTEQLNKGKKDAAAALLIDAYKSADLRDEGGTVIAEGDKRLKATLALRVGDLYRESAQEMQGKGAAESSVNAHRDAVEWYGKSVADKPDAGNVQEAYNGMGVSQHALGDVSGANASFARAVEANTDRMGKIRAIIDRDGNDALAKRELGKLVEDQRSYQNNLGVAQYVSGDKAAARDSIITQAFNYENDPQLGEVRCKNKTICDNVAQLADERIAEIKAQPGGPEQAELSRELDLKLLAENRARSLEEDDGTVLRKAAAYTLSLLGRLRGKKEPQEIGAPAEERQIQPEVGQGVPPVLAEAARENGQGAPPVITGSSQGVPPVIGEPGAQGVPPVIEERSEGNPPAAAPEEGGQYKPAEGGQAAVPEVGKQKVPDDKESASPGQSAEKPANDAPKHEGAGSESVREVSKLVWSSDNELTIQYSDGGALVLGGDMVEEQRRVLAAHGQDIGKRLKTTSGATMDDGEDYMATRPGLQVLIEGGERIAEFKRQANL